MISLRGVPAVAIPSLLKRSLSPAPTSGHVFICIADHYEPDSGGADLATQHARVDRWLAQYPRLFAHFRDSRGQSPQHTFFFPAEAYVAEHLEKLARLCALGHGAVEVHLHHRHDTPENLRSTLTAFLGRLENHGLAKRDHTGRVTYAFIHGNWALNNSRCDRDWCGVDDETSILLETGCYADFTMPSAPADCQTKTINSIYYARSTPGKPKGHDVGTRASVGGKPGEDSLLLIQGPLLADWRAAKLGFLPGLENGDLHGGRPPSLARLRLWLRAGVHVAGRRDWHFVKLHTHGAPERNADMLLGEPMQRFHADLAQWAASNPAFRYYYVTAREMAMLVHQAEAGVSHGIL